MEATVQQQAQPSLLRDMVMLTKPRIISLLLVTTVAPMFVAGNPGWLALLVVLVGGYLMAGGANAVNMYLDRDIDTRMARTRLRPIPSGRMGAAVGARVRNRARDGRDVSARALHQRAHRGSRTRRFLFLRLRLHAVAQANDAAEHRDRRSGGRLSAAGRLGGDDGHDRPHRGLPVPDRVLLDAAAFLGARAAQAARLRQGRSADGAARMG